MNMKSVKKLVVLLAIGAAIMGMSGCAGGPKTGAGQQKTQFQLIDWKNANIGSPVPKWYEASNALRIQALDDYKGYYCFIVRYESEPKNEATGNDKEWATGWVTNTANGLAQISTMISVSTNNKAAATTGQPRTGGNSEAARARMAAINGAMSNASLNNVRMVDDFWLLSKNLTTKRQNYIAASLWVIPAEDFNAQVIKNYQAIILDNNTALGAEERASYGELIKNAQSRVDEILDLEPVSQEDLDEYGGGAAE
jgi:hypothetical protein